MDLEIPRAREVAKCQYLCSCRKMALKFRTDSQEKWIKTSVSVPTGYKLLKQLCTQPTQNLKLPMVL